MMKILVLFLSLYILAMQVFASDCDHFLSSLDSESSLAFIQVMNALRENGAIGEDEFRGLLDSQTPTVSFLDRTVGSEPYRKILLELIEKGLDWPRIREVVSLWLGEVEQERFRLSLDRSSTHELPSLKDLGTLGFELYEGIAQSIEIGGVVKFLIAMNDPSLPWKRKNRNILYDVRTHLGMSLPSDELWEDLGFNEFGTWKRPFIFKLRRESRMISNLFLPGTRGFLIREILESGETVEVKKGYRWSRVLEYGDIHEGSSKFRSVFFDDKVFTGIWGDRRGFSSSAFNDHWIDVLDLETGVRSQLILDDKVIGSSVIPFEVAGRSYGVFRDYQKWNALRLVEFSDRIEEMRETPVRSRRIEAASCRSKDGSLYGDIWRKSGERWVGVPVEGGLIRYDFGGDARCFDLGTFTPLYEPVTLNLDGEVVDVLVGYDSPDPVQPPQLEMISIDFNSGKILKRWKEISSIFDVGRYARMKNFPPKFLSRGGRTYMVFTVLDQLERPEIVLYDVDLEDEVYRMLVSGGYRRATNFGILDAFELENRFFVVTKGELEMRFYELLGL